MAVESGVDMGGVAAVLVPKLRLGNAALEALLPLAGIGKLELPGLGSQAELGNQWNGAPSPSLA